MSQFYTLTEVSPLGDPWIPSEPGAKPIQNHWCKVEGEEWNVMVGKQVKDDGSQAIQVGDSLYGDLIKTTSAKGNNYWKFKSQKVPDGVQRPAQAPRTQAQAVAQETIGAVPGWALPLINQITDIHRMVAAIHEDISPGLTQAKVNDAYVETKQEEPFPDTPPEPTIDPATEQSLKEIFGE